jgi:hypothetical protein
MVERALSRWQAAGLLDAHTVARITAWEAAHAGRSRFNWPVLIALALGSLAVGAGVLLFVAAHWDSLSPAVRFAVVLALVVGFHLGGVACRARFPALATALHGLGTSALGAGIFLSAQIFHLQEHWPTGVLLWAVGAWAGWWLLRDWVQTLWVAVLTPAWLVGEWTLATAGLAGAGTPVTIGLFTLALAYLAARSGASDSAARHALCWLGALGLVPVALLMFASIEYRHGSAPGGTLFIVGWAAALAAPLALAWALRGRQSWPVLVGAAWAVLAAVPVWPPMARYLWCALAAVALVVWGLAEARRERVNLGVAAFAVTVLAFYFSSVADKLGRALSLVVIGVLLLLGGYLLERLRRRLLAGMAAA